MKRLRKKQAFTLIELVIVIAVIAILAAVLLPSFASIIANAKENARIQQITTARNEILGSSSDIITILDLEGYIFVIDEKAYIIDGQGQVISADDLEYSQIELDYTKAPVQSSNKKVTIYLPKEEDQEIKIEIPLTFTLDEENKTATVKGYLDTITSNYTIPSYIGEYDSQTGKYYITKNNTYKVTAIADEAFKGCTLINNISIPAMVTSIGTSAFRDCSALKSVNIPTTISNIGESAFRYCEALETFSIPTSIDRINNYVFEGCSVLNNITIPNNITRIGYSAFRACIELTSIAIPDTVTIIGESAFRYCHKLSNVTLSTTIDKISEYMFSYCPELESITIPNSVTSIEANAFSSCSKLNNIIIPNTVTSIGEQAFATCTSLTTIEFKHTAENTLTITDGAFSLTDTLETTIKCPLSNEYLPLQTVISSYDWLASNRTVYYYVYEKTPLKLTLDETNKTASVTGYYSDLPSTYVMPEYVDEYNEEDGRYYFTNKNTYKITGISDNAFKDSNLITNLTLPDSITGMGISAFENCQELVKIELSSTIRSIGTSSFKNCVKLSDITIPSTITNIQDYTFQGCSNLETVSFLGNVTSIGNSVFKNCSKLVNVSIPSTVTSIGWSAFQNTAITEITLPSKIKILEEEIFRNTPLTSIKIPSSVEDLQTVSFAGCTSLTKIEFEHTAENSLRIDSSSFMLDENLDTTIKCPLDSNNLPLQTAISSYDWVGSKRNVSYVLPVQTTLKFTLNEQDKIAVVSGYFDDLPSTYTIPEYIDGYNETTGRYYTNGENVYRVVAIGENAFKECDKIEKLDASGISTNYGGYITVGAQAFYSNPSLKEITLPKDFSMGANAFDWCIALTSINMEDYGLDYIPEYAFSYCSALTSLTLPQTVTYIENHAFTNCSNLNSINLDYVSEYIGEGAFANTGITNINSLTAQEIKKEAFFGCESIKEFATTQLITIRQSAFLGCTGLEYLSIPNATLKGVEIFRNCTNLEYAEIGEVAASEGPSVEEMSDGIFYECTNLSQVVIGGSNLCEAMFINCTALTTITMSNVVEISPYAFQNCTSLDYIDLYGKTSIGAYAFDGCTGLYQITIPDSVIYIGFNAFGNCENLTSITFEHQSSNSIELSGAAFDSSNSIITNVYCIVEEVEGYNVPMIFMLGWESSWGSRVVSYYSRW